MEERAYRQYEIESENWLKVGRRNLLLSLIGHAVSGRSDLEILDLGAGVGQNVPALRTLGKVDVLEINPIGLQALKQMEGIRRIYDQPVPLPLERRYDVVVATDVVEHIEDDQAAIAWIADHLEPGGIFFSTVPAYQWLFSDHDVALHHFRRYSARAYDALMSRELVVERLGYFNSILFPLAATARLLGRLRTKAHADDSPRKQSGVMPPPVDRLFRKVLAIETKLIERRLGLPYGLSVYCLARRPSVSESRGP